MHINEYVCINSSFLKIEHKYFTFIRLQLRCDSQTVQRKTVLMFGTQVGIRLALEAPTVRPQWYSPFEIVCITTPLMMHLTVYCSAACCLSLP